jgi:hypothetical protein
MRAERITSGTIALMLLLNLHQKTLSILIQTEIFPSQQHIYDYHHRDNESGRT